jgi:hypothetical protein
MDNAQTLNQLFTGGKMENTRTSNRNFGMMAWGAIFVWWGITELFSLPSGMDVIGFGLIFLGVNGVLGILALVWGGLDLAPLVLHLPFKLPVFAIWLIVLGVTLLAFVPLRVRKTNFGNLS